MLRLLYLLFAIFFSSAQSLYSQKTSFEKLVTEVEAKFTIELDTTSLCDFFVIDGVPTSQDSIKRKLSGIKQSEILSLALVDANKTRITEYNCDYLIVVNIKEYQSRKTKLAALDKIKSNLNESLPQITITDFECADCQQVMIDGKRLLPYEAKTFLDTLRPKDILNIAFYTSPNPLVYGSNSKNGLVDIKLKK
ncbi:hypothetical protein [Roseivirga pacifica]|uniref:hypothetical protein n=1 Tax=Roseivirga pacifica TaxID=1267423 RepID=UPI003BB1B1E0